MFPKTKECSQCGLSKLLKYFYPQERGLYKRRSKCSTCCRKNRIAYSTTLHGIKITKQYRDRTREKQNAKQRERYKIPEVKTAKQAYKKKYGKNINKKYRLKNKDKILSNNQKRRALKSKIDQIYTASDILYTLELFRHKCFNCQSKNYLCIDHHRPLSKGYKLSRTNAVILCRCCNSSKGSKYPENFYTKKQLKHLLKLGIK